MTSLPAKLETASGVTAPAKPPRVLVVDDEELVQRLLKAILSRHHYDVVLASNGDEALDRAVDHAPDLVILDLTLPGMSGLEVCRELRSWLAAPILVLSGRGEEAVKIKALDQGADDYLTKPFATGELLARLRALLRRASTLAAPMPVLKSGDLTIDVARRRVFQGQREIRLTRTEFDILAYLARNGGCVVTSKMVMEQVWGPRYTDDTQTLRVHVGHLRKKIEPDPPAPRYILTEPGVGYRFSAP
ncbi:MAG TPA: response regulator transcription factor [Bryobacterales bacterium]|nr:response regulator transcription factor [Bryobacterales bacterium]